ncbi:uncharacterized protein STEHIDRAFT_117646 [Stereum hirsutum FP-91666 SS1]|uniref:uncharacterized protein n=1 Tax=Stereum hirsutum (strain FP-91666) TaxID=721885 RepID=UPI000440A53C|nr:uncharacterized protein STEHIDRAFT_117646 [Stereum hirsutum FP-91666 SS1]EIM92671.1 hypothetical protein STEHIDRAFT_117646 [Stereum hirsutum FP-91666 SS1]
MFQPTLKHFILRQEALNLYRYAIRASRAIPSSPARKETIAWIRAEFERNRFIFDVDVIEQKLASGRREIRQFLPSQPLHL